MRFILVILLLLICTIGKGQVFNEVSVELFDVVGRVKWCDINSDQKMDLIYLGTYFEDGQYDYAGKIYINNGNDEFEELLSPVLPQANHGTKIDLADFNGDGEIDFLICGWSQNLGRFTKILKNNIKSEGKLEDYATLNDYSGIGRWADYDNDGDLDIIFFGYKFIQGPGGFYKSTVYENIDNSFYESEINFGDFSGSELKVIDFNVDGKMDFAVIGSGEDYSYDGKLFLNNGGEYEEVSSVDFVPTSPGSMSVGDYNSDGFPDLITTGSPGNTGFSTTVYQNVGGNTFSIDTDVSLVETHGGHAEWGDYDNNGELDMVIVGTNPDADGGVTRKIYSNSNGVFTELANENIPALSGGGTVSWGDYDGDGDLDLVTAGSTAYGYHAGKVAIYKNTSESTNTQPTAPSLLTSGSDESTFTFNWNSGSDTETSVDALTYNIYIQHESGTYAISPNSHADGTRKIVSLGNVQHNKSHTISRHIPPGDYTWSVQAIDNAFVGSSFAEEQSFHVNYPPEIQNAEKTSLVEEASFKISLNDITIFDPDNVFPDDFSFSVLEGSNYTLIDNEVTPALDFFGQMTIPIIVEDHLDKSAVYHMTVDIININDIPKIESQVNELTTYEDIPIQITLNDISVVNLDVAYPDDFSLVLGEGENYTIDGDRVSPVSDFHGTLSVPVHVNDGQDDSPVFNLLIDVLPVNDIPVIIGQTNEPVINEDTRTEMSLNDISVIGIDGTYPNDFSLILFEGENYTIENAQIIPSADFNGILSVSVQVSDGDDNSPFFYFQITLLPVNDIPEIVEQINELRTIEDMPIEISLNDISVINRDVTYPDDFSLIINEGNNYTIFESRIFPTPGFIGELMVPVLVNDQQDFSNVFNISITVEALLSEPNQVLTNSDFFPNPFHNSIRIQSSELLALPKFVVFDLTGKTVVTLELGSAYSKEIVEVNLDYLDKGTYIGVLMDGEKKIRTKRIVKQF